MPLPLPPTLTLLPLPPLPHTLHLPAAASPTCLLGGATLLPLHPLPALACPWVPCLPATCPTPLPCPTALYLPTQVVGGWDGAYCLPDGGDHSLLRASQPYYPSPFVVGSLLIYTCPSSALPPLDDWLVVGCYLCLACCLASGAHVLPADGSSTRDGRLTPSPRPRPSPPCLPNALPARCCSRAVCGCGGSSLCQRLPTPRACLPRRWLRYRCLALLPPCLRRVGWLVAVPSNAALPALPCLACPAARLYPHALRVGLIDLTPFPACGWSCRLGGPIPPPSTRPLLTLQRASLLPPPRPLPQPSTAAARLRCRLPPSPFTPLFLIPAQRLGSARFGCLRVIRLAYPHPNALCGSSQQRWISLPTATLPTCSGCGWNVASLRTRFRLPTRRLTSQPLLTLPGGFPQPSSSNCALAGRFAFTPAYSTFDYLPCPVLYMVYYLTLLPYLPPPPRLAVILPSYRALRCGCGYSRWLVG